MKLQVAFLCCFVTLSAATDLCSWGESYWCSSLRHAKDCGAFRHCLTTVWQNQKLATDTTEICQYCESVVGDVRAFITDKQTQSQLQQYLDSACSLIPNAQLSQQCKDYVNNDLQEVLDLIASELDPQTVCSLIGLCSGLEDTVQHSMPANRVPIMRIPEAQLEPVCTDCKKFMTDIKNLATSPATEKEIEQLLEDRLCNMLVGFVDECKALVQSYLPELMELLTSDFDPAQICGAAGFCNSTAVRCPKVMLAKMRLQKSPLFQKVRGVSVGAECEICRAVITEIQMMDKNPQTQAEVKKFLKDNICLHLGSYKQECDATVEQFAPELFELIAAELDPNTLCQSLGFCSVGNNIPSMKKDKATIKKTTASAECIMCEFVIQKLDTILDDNATEAEIMMALDKVCSLMPTTIAAECTNFVDTYGRAIIALLQSELKPEQVCTVLGLCTSGAAVKKVGQSELCGICETIIGYLDAILEQNATVVEIEKALEKICNFLPDAERKDCDNMVEQYGPILVQLISQYADPNEICALIKLCNSTSSDVHMVKIVPAKAQLLGTNECTYGPVFWCSSQANAEKCKAVDHCKKHVWN